ncbi:MAG: CBS domain-containing protein, partial [Alcaligenaceae bacterium]|nr:CBS domain-containing protein [Alcaligenaceae bacterium]
MSDPSPSDSEPRQPKPGPKSLFARLTTFMRPTEPEDREDVKDFLEAAHDKKVLDSEAYTMLSGALDVANQTVSDIMVPRSKMDMLDISRPLSEVLPTIIETGHSRFPVYEGDRDNIMGILLAKDLLLSISNPQLDLRPLVRPAVFIPETKRLNVLLREFRSSRNHLAIVIDEHGGTAGLVTMEDVLEQIVGDIEDEYDEDEEKTIFQTGSNSWRAMGITNICAFNRHFNTALP